MTKYKNHMILILFAASYLFAVVASFTAAKKVAMIIGSPALLKSGWAFFGHLVTLDDDMPGEWSNPEGSKRSWFMSLGELLIKIILFVVLLVLVYL